MIKFTIYNGKSMLSTEVDSTPYADMKRILEAIIPGAWRDYMQIINSEDDLFHDLGVIYFDDIYWIPVHNITAWLYSFHVRAMKGANYERFRKFRRNVENVFRCAWAMPMNDPIVRNKGYFVDWDIDGERSIYELGRIFQALGVPDNVLKDCLDDGKAYGPLTYIEHIAGSTACGSRGYLLCDMIQYVEDMPLGNEVFNYINGILMTEIPHAEEDMILDNYLDELNSMIGHYASRFVGE